jgi:hypothetical protein
MTRRGPAVCKQPHIPGEFLSEKEFRLQQLRSHARRGANEKNIACLDIQAGNEIS